MPDQVDNERQRAVGSVRFVSLPKKVPMRAGDRDLIRDLNRSLILNLVRERRSISRADLARESGLSPSTVTSITASLLAEGFLLEDAEGGRPSGTARRLGRPATLLRVNPVAGFAAGIKIAPDSLTATLTDLTAEPLVTLDTPLGPRVDARRLPRLVADAVAQVIERAGVARERVFGLGIGVPGIVEPASGRVSRSPLARWLGAELARRMEEQLGLPVLVDNDVNTLTVAEQLFGAGRGIANFVVVTIGRGIGMGVVVNGVVYRGAAGGAGEIGHAEVATDGPRCWCGRRGCLEAVAAEPAVVRDVLGSTGRLLAPADLAAAAEEDERVRQILERAGEFLGHVLETVVLTLDPARVVISGEGVRLGSHYLDTAREVVRRRLAERSPEFSVEPWGDDAWARGAATLVLRELFHPAHLRADEALVPAAFEHSGASTSLAQAGRRGR